MCSRWATTRFRSIRKLVAAPGFPSTACWIFQQQNASQAQHQNANQAQQQQGTSQAFKDFAKLVNQVDRGKLKQIPGFVPRVFAVGSDAHIREALQKMDRYNADWLPVLTSEEQLGGIVDRSRLLANVILDVTKRLEGARPGE